MRKGLEHGYHDQQDEGVCADSIPATRTTVLPRNHDPSKARTERDDGPGRHSAWRSVKSMRAYRSLTFLHPRYTGAVSTIESGFHAYQIEMNKKFPGQVRARGV